MTLKAKRRKQLWSSFRLFVLTLMAFLGFRWIVLEPYVIPSGSMIPSLLVHDHIAVWKFGFGLRVPFSSQWILGPYLPHRGQILVFRSVENNSVFMVKRLVGLPGDSIALDEQGALSINGEAIPYEIITSPDPSWVEEFGDDVEFRREKLGEASYITMYRKELRRDTFDVVVPEGSLFFLGDNRDRSRDSRSWGSAPISNLMGEVGFIWLSCSETLSGASYLCDFRHLRSHRIFSAPGMKL